MNDPLDARELKTLVQSVFSPTMDDRHLLLIVDVPDDTVPDTDLWRTRRRLVEGGHQALNAAKPDLGLESVRLLAYPNVHANNANLPQWGVFVEADLEGLTRDRLAAMANRVDIEAALADVQIVMAGAGPVGH